jgi:hypothetical protein
VKQRTNKYKIQNVTQSFVVTQNLTSDVVCVVLTWYKFVGYTKCIQKTENIKHEP